MQYRWPLRLFDFWSSEFVGIDTLLENVKVTSVLPSEEDTQVLIYKLFFLQSPSSSYHIQCTRGFLALLARLKTNSGDLYSNGNALLVCGTSRTIQIRDTALGK